MNDGTIKGYLSLQTVLLIKRLWFPILITVFLWLLSSGAFLLMKRGL